MSEQPKPPNPPKPSDLNYMAVHRRSNDPVEDQRRAKEARRKMWEHIAKVRSAERPPSPGSGNKQDP
jgi:hypothetical protein